MRVVCQQPGYFPWLGYFEQIAAADAFVVLDDVQWIRQGRQHRTRLPAQASSTQEKDWLTIPVHGHGHRAKPLRDLEIDRSQAWARHHWHSLQARYGRAPFFRTQLEPIARPYFERAASFRFLIEACEASVASLWGPLQLAAPIWHSSHLEVNARKSERLVRICQILEATEYYAALGSSRYLDLSAFRAANMRVRFQHFRGNAEQIGSRGNAEQALSRGNAEPARSRPVDLSVLDWLAYIPLEQIRACLGSRRGSQLERKLEAAVDGVMRPVSGLMN